MKIETSKQTIEVITIAPVGEINSFTAPDLRKHLKTLIDEDHINFILDLRKVEFMDSAGMSALVSLLKQARQKEGEVKLVWSNSEKANRVIKLTRFDRVFEIFDTVEAARNAF